jgi:hypothetical protein
VGVDVRADGEATATWTMTNSDDATKRLDGSQC